MREVFENDIDQIDISELEDDIIVEEENAVFEYPDPLYKLKLEYSSEYPQWHHHYRQRSLPAV